MIYDYLLTAFKVIVGLITTERLIYAASLALGFYLLWIMFSLAFSFQKKFNRNCVKLYNFVKKSGLNANDVNSVDLKASKISSGFSHGWKRFKSSSTGKPSDFITRRDALDVEVTGGVLNQGKSFMRSFINIATFVLFLANFAYLGNSTLISCYLVAEAMVLPLIFFVICKIFYFVYTSVKQQLYKADIECLYELLDLLDSIFAKEGMVVASLAGNGAFVQGEDEIATTEGEELPALEPENVEEQSESGEQSETQSESGENAEEKKEELVEPEDIGDKYDFFKKKNLDVDKLISEVPNTSSSLPYINVDSDYVIKDDDAPAVSKSITNLENGSELLGGMMQDMSSIRKQKDEDSKTKDEPTEENKEGESEENKIEEKTEEPLAETSDDDKSEDPLASLGDFEVAENAEKSETENAAVEEEKKEEVEPVEEVEDVKLEIPDVEPIELPEPEVEEILEPEVEEISEEKKDNIAAIVGGFKSKSKLASGGVVIERNEPIARREKVTSYSEPEETSYSESSYNDSYNNNYVPNAGITHLNAEDNTDNILNSFRSSAGGYEDYPVYNGVQGGMYNQGYGAPQYNQGYSYPQGGYNAPVSPAFGAQGYQGAMQPQSFGGYNEPESYDESYDEEIEEYDDDEIVEDVKKPAKKSAAKRSKEDEPRPRNLKKKESKTAMAEAIIEKSKRGRPKKQVFDETVTIKNDKEFDEVLSRAEKLMKKSESGLSASQAKRIEKELKMLMDAMNKYKEGV